MAGTAESAARRARIGRFLVEAELGRGAQGAVFRCVDPQLRRRVAIKLLAPVKSTDPRQSNGTEAVREMFAEGQNVGRLRHPNVVSVFEAGMHQGQPYLVFEFVAGRTLTSMMRDRKGCPPGEALPILEQIAAGLAHAHANGVMHLDLGPGNVMLDEQGVARIMDFGLSRMVTRGFRSGVIMGTPNFMAPEQFQGGDVGPHTDVYAAGLLGYRLITGVSAVRGRTMNELVEFARSGQIDFGRLIATGMPPAFEALMRAALARNPKARLRDGGELHAQIKACLQPDDRASASHPTVEFLLRRMRLKGEFPALSANLVAINQLTAEGGNASVKTLSQIILRDYALANRLLKLVNSAFYGSGRQPITTVSDAVMRLGFEQVRIACNALLYAGCLVDTDPERAARLRNMQVEALLAGLLARYVATTSRFGDPEELFLCGMLRHLGETLAAYCFPEEFAYIAGMIGSGMHPDQAFREVLGVTEPEIALAVGAEWKLPATFVNSMRPLPEGLVTVPADAAGRTLVVAAFANDLCRIATRAPAGEADLRLGALSTRFEPCIKTAPEALRTLLVSAARKLDDFLPALGLKAEDTPALARVRDWIPAPD